MKLLAFLDTFLYITLNILVEIKNGFYHQNQRKILSKNDLKNCQFEENSFFFDISPDGHQIFFFLLKTP